MEANRPSRSAELILTHLKRVFLGPKRVAKRHDIVAPRLHRGLFTDWIDYTIASETRRQQSRIGGTPMAHFREEDTKMGASATTVGANWRHWEPGTAATGILRPPLSGNVKGEPCLEEEIRGEAKFEGIVGQSAALRQVLQLVETVAHTESTVLLLGETGTGK